MPILTELTHEGSTPLHVPVKIWARWKDVETEAGAQLRRTAMLPFVFKHVAAMPDVHLGKGATVGSVVPTKGALCPACVGVDIGCGMTAVRLDVEPARLLDDLPRLRRAFERSVPVDHHGNRFVSPEVEAWEGWKAWERTALGARDGKGRYLEKARTQLGSLGGGNHFIEVCLDTGGRPWLMLHSGSRNVGKELAEHHIDVAKGLMREAQTRLPDPDLAHLLEGTPPFLDYWHDLSWAQAYAFANRREMLRKVLKDVSYHLGFGGAPVPTSFEVSCHHNYVAREVHFNEEVLVTRKGAVRAGAGELGIIPGSMGTKSYIVRGKGHPESFESCSHGAGRRYGRNEARRRFGVEDLRRQTAGVECRKDEGVVDEIPSAYKDIDEVMANQRDLVEIVAELKQVLCVKG